MAVWSSRTFVSLANTSSLRAWELLSSCEICSSKAYRYRDNTILKQLKAHKDFVSLWREKYLDLGSKLFHHSMLLLNNLKGEKLGVKTNFVMSIVISILSDEPKQSGAWMWNRWKMIQFNSARDFDWSIKPKLRWNDLNWRILMC